MTTICQYQDWPVVLAHQLLLPHRCFGVCVSSDVMSDDCHFGFTLSTLSLWNLHQWRRCCPQVRRETWPQTWSRSSPLMCWGAWIGKSHEYCPRWATPSRLQAQGLPWWTCFSRRGWQWSSKLRTYMGKRTKKEIIRLKYYANSGRVASKVDPSSSCKAGLALLETSNCLSLSCRENPRVLTQRLGLISVFKSTIWKDEYITWLPPPGPTPKITSLEA